MELAYNYLALIISFPLVSVVSRGARLGRMYQLLEDTARS